MKNHQGEQLQHDVAASSSSSFWHGNNNNNNNNRMHEYQGLFYFAVGLVLAWYATQLAAREPCASWIVAWQQRQRGRKQRLRQGDDEEEPTEHSDEGSVDERDEDHQELVEVGNP